MKLSGALATLAFSICLSAYANPILISDSLIRSADEEYPWLFRHGITMPSESIYSLVDFSQERVSACLNSDEFRSRVIDFEVAKRIPIDLKQNVDERRPMYVTNSSCNDEVISRSGCNSCFEAIELTLVEKIQRYALNDRESDAHGKEIVVVGAGPGGLYFAIDSALKGLKVTIVESRTFTRAKVFGTFPREEAYLASLGLPHNYYSSFSDYSEDGTFLFSKNTMPLMVKQTYLAGIALKLGVKIWAGYEAKGFSGENFNNGLVIKKGENQILLPFDILIVADGSQSKIRSLLPTYQGPDVYVPLEKVAEADIEAVVSGSKSREEFMEKGGEGTEYFNSFFTENMADVLSVLKNGDLSFKRWNILYDFPSNILNYHLPIPTCCMRGFHQTFSVNPLTRGADPSYRTHVEGMLPNYVTAPSGEIYTLTSLMNTLEDKEKRELMRVILKGMALKFGTLNDNSQIETLVADYMTKEVSFEKLAHCSASLFQFVDGMKGTKTNEDSITIAGKFGDNKEYYVIGDAIQDAYYPLGHGTFDAFRGSKAVGVCLDYGMTSPECVNSIKQMERSIRKRAVQIILAIYDANVTEDRSDFFNDIFIRFFNLR